MSPERHWILYSLTCLVATSYFVIVSKELIWITHSRIVPNRAHWIVFGSREYDAL